MMTRKRRAADIGQRVAETIASHRMLDKSDRVLVAVSGGPDSVALLLVLVDQAPQHNLELGVAHLNHGLRGKASDHDETFVRRLAQRLSLPFHTKKIHMEPHAGSLEERAREQRYNFFEEVVGAHHYTKVALGHHADDNAEAFLINLLRGSGSLGLAGIPPVRAKRYIRPLIQLRRTDIIVYLKDRGQDYRQDLSNADMRFERNRIRHHLLPLLEKKYNPAVVDILNRTARLCSDDETWFESYLKPFIAGIVIETTPQTLSLSRPALCSHPPVIRRRLLRHVLRQWQGHIRRLGAAHIERLSALSASPGLQRHHLPNEVIAVSKGNRLQFHRGPLAQPPCAYEYAVTPCEAEPLSVFVPAAGCRLEMELMPAFAPERAGKTGKETPGCVWFDRDLLTFPLTIRNFRDGDRFRPFGMQGSQKVKKLFIDKKIDRDRRRTIPLLMNGSTIIWIAGIRRGAHAPITAHTKTMLKVTIIENLQGS